jgi:RimJ/RimL family protein N-acetyltransferase/mannose-6-phosphate isomerase-like protein (cupin superfamily)
MVGSLLCSRTGGEDHVARRAKRPLTGEVLLRDVRRGDLRSFFEHQLDPEASRMAGFPTRNRKSFLAHWEKVLGDESVVKQTILFDGEVAGNVVSFLHAGEREVGYWIGREFWGRGVATRALAEFLRLEVRRPLYANVVRHNVASVRVLENCGFRISGEDPEGLVLKLAEGSMGMKVESEGLFVGPDEGKALPNPIGGRMVLKVRDGDTGGSFSVHDNVIPAGSPGPLPHLHRDHEETFYVLEGELTVRVGERRITAPVGSFVVIPRGVVHQPSNPGTEPTRVLLIFSPSGMEHFFEEAAEGRIPLQAIPTDPDVLERRDAFAAKYGYEFAM